jgi:hypothetical protein
MKIEIKHRYTNAVLWSGEAVDLREGVKIALVAKADLRGANLYGTYLRDANLRGAYLREANLSEANLYGADLSGTDLYGADLRGADLRDANLSEANLYGADLSYANLSEANLSGANLRDANLRGANLSEAKSGSVCRMDFGGWSICIREDKTSIGCKTYPNADWLKWTPKDIAGFEANAESWWKLYGPAIKSAIKVVMKKAKLNEKGGEK